MSLERRRWVPGLPTHAELESEDHHPAEESPQGPIPTGPEFRAMRLILGLSLGELARRTAQPVHRLASIESRPLPLGDLDELVLHTVLMKSGARWHPDLARLLALSGSSSDVQDWADLLDRTGSADLADLDEMVGPWVQVTEAAGQVVVHGHGIEALMAFPLDLEEVWDVVEDIAAEHVHQPR